MVAILVLLLNRRRITAQALADRFEVSVRTVYRDIEALNLAGIPVISNQGAGGGYEIPDNYKLNKQYLSSRDMRAILSALKGVNAALDDHELDILYQKVQSLLPEDLETAEAASDAYILFDPLGWDHSNRFARRIQTLYRAARGCRLTRLDYADAQGALTTRRVEPMTIVQKGVSWYLFAYCLKRKDFRLFKLSRIRDIHVEEILYERRPTSYRTLQSSWEMTRDAMPERVRVVLKFDSRMAHVVTDYFENAYRIENNDGHLIVEDRLPLGQWLLGMILSFGSAVEVIRPDTLRDQVQNEILRMKARYP